jgi:hypothetical protein
MSRYDLWVFLHVASVIVWLGAGTTVALIALYAQRAGDGVILQRLAGLTGWLGPRVFAPASLGALGFGFAVVHSGHWPSQLWIHVGVIAFAISFLLNVAVRLPLSRRTRNGGMQPLRAARVFRSLALVELTILYLTVADMVAKPESSDTGTLSVGGAILALVVLLAVATALRSGGAGEGLPASNES